MKIARILIVLLFAACIVARGQDFPRAELFAGYSLMNVDNNGITSRLNASGWEVSGVVSFTKRIAFETLGATYFKTYPILLFTSPAGAVCTVLGCPPLFGPAASGLTGCQGTPLACGSFVNVNARNYSVVAGPRINIRPVFLHALFGFDYLVASNPLLYIAGPQFGFAAAIGGGIEHGIAPHLAVRGGLDYVLTRHNIFGGPFVDQNNIRVSVGIVFTTVGRQRQRTGTLATTTVARPPSVPTAPFVPTAPSNTSFGVSGYPTQLGFTIVSVVDDSPASRLGLNQGDVILEIDHQPVHNKDEVDGAVARNSSGTVSVRYMVQGVWTVEHPVKLK